MPVMYNYQVSIDAAEKLHGYNTCELMIDG